MYNSIIICSCLFGSVYIFSTSLQLINGALLEKKKIPNNIIIINIISGSVFLYTLKALKNI